MLSTVTLPVKNVSEINQTIFFFFCVTLSWISPSLVALYKKSEKSDLFFLPKNEQFAGKTKDSIPKDVQASNSQTFNNKKMSLK